MSEPEAPTAPQPQRPTEPVCAAASGPLRWVFDEVRRTLEQASAAVAHYVQAHQQAQQGDLSEVDRSELRLLSQALHQAVGALELVELHAAAQTLRALESALQQLMQRPALANAATAQAVQRGCWALIDFLGRILRHCPAPAAALFATYRELQLLAGAARIHPADLWACEPRRVLLPSAAALEPRPELRVRLEQKVLAWVKQGDAAAAAALVPLLAGLAQGAQAEVARAYWFAAAACMELLAQRRLVADVYVKRSVAALLAQFAALQQGRFEQTVALTHELLYLLAHTPPQASEPAHVQAHRDAYGWDAPPVAHGVAAGALGQVDPQRLDAARAALEAAQQAWAQWNEAAAGPSAASAASAAALQRLAQSLIGLVEGARAQAAPVQAAQHPAAEQAAPTWDDWAAALAALAQPLQQAAAQVPAAGAAPAGLAWELSTALLWLGAELDDFQPWDAQRLSQMQQWQQRLQAALQGLPPAETPDWLRARTQALHARQGRSAALALMRRELGALEQDWTAWLQGPPQAAPVALPAALERLQTLERVASALVLEPAQQTLAALRASLQALAASAAPTEVQAQPLLQALSDNLTALGVWLDALVQSGSAAAPSGFRFDAQQQRLLALRPAATAHALPPAEAQPIEPAAAPLRAAPANAAAPSDLATEADTYAMIDVFWHEAQALAEQIEHTLALLGQQPGDRPNLQALRRAFHTLKGSARMVGQDALGASAYAVERQLNLLLADALALDAGAQQACEQALQGLHRWLQQHAPAPATAPAPAPATAPVAASATDAPQPPALRGAPVPEQVPVLRQALLLPPLLNEPVKLIGPLRLELDLFQVFLSEAEAWARTLQDGLQPLSALSGQGAALDAKAVDWDHLAATAHALTGGAATVGFSGLSSLARALEQALSRLGAQPGAGLPDAVPKALAPAPAPAQPVAPAQGRDPVASLSPHTLWVLTQGVEQVHQLLHQFAAGVLREPRADVLAALADLASAGAAALVPEPAAPAPPAPAAPAPAEAPTRVDLEPDLLLVFVDEAHTLLPQLASALRQWRARPEHGAARSELLRHLHTFKGSARLAGATALGDCLHQLESQTLALPVAPPALDMLALQQGLDTAERLLAQLERDARHAAAGYLLAASTPTPSTVADASAGAHVPVPAPPAPPEADAAAGAAPLPSFALSPTTPQALWPASERVAAANAAPTLRLSADWLDRLVLHAADVNQSRTQLEADLRQLRRSLSDMGSNVARLRVQLRDFELQTETQLPLSAPAPSLAQSRAQPDARFDPLELDRYTRAQEQARLLAETVNDVATVQHQMLRSLQAAEGALAAQARQTRELQRDALRSRQVSLDALVERLQRSVRLLAQECGKSVELDCIGTLGAEIERSLLERLAPVLEHLLRNAVVHGLESDALRQALGKPLPGRIRLEWQAQQGENVLRVSDDGAGLNLERIGAQAQALGLLPPGASCSPEQACELIFAAGLSTAAEVTGLAGRGIGLAAVRQDVTALGGLITCQLSAAPGCAFKLRLPRSSNLSQVLLLRLGEFVFGVPLERVQRLQQVAATELSSAYASATWTHEGQSIPFHWAGALLALSAESTDAHTHQQRHWPLLVCSSAGQQVAWHVDEVLGQQEVVLKPMPPPMDRMPGLVGAALLASGSVALVYNPVAVTALCTDAAREWVRLQRAPQPSVDPGQGSSAPLFDRAKAAAALVLVADDSITVRRVTQRLLQREGYRVALAADGWQALEQIERERPALLLCDIEMPRLDGFGLLERLRAEPRWADLPVLVISSRAAEKHRQHAHQLGVVHYLGKPYAEAELLSLVQRYAVSPSHLNPSNA